MKNKHEAPFLECISNKHAIVILSNQNKVLNKAIETERSEHLSLAKSNEGLKERCKMRTGEKARLTKEVVYLEKSKPDNHAMQCKLEFAKREHESVPSRYNAAELKVKKCRRCPFAQCL